MHVPTKVTKVANVTFFSHNMDDLQNAESKFDDGAEARIPALTAHVPSPPSEKSFVAVPNATESVSTPLVSEAASPMPLDSFSDQSNKKVPRTKKAPSAPRAKKVKIEEAHVTDDESAGRFNEEDDEEHTKLYCICKSLYGTYTIEPVSHVQITHTFLLQMKKG